MYTFSMVIWGALRAAIFAFSVAVALAQSGSGTISGTILDNLGAPLPQAEIQAKNAASGAVFKAMSAAKGDYTLSGLPAGAYEFAVIVRAGRRHVENIAVEAMSNCATTINSARWATIFSAPLRSTEGLSRPVPRHGLWTARSISPASGDRG
jgi:hypothetical protein